MIGIIGGTGFYSLIEKTEELDMETPYGKPSSKIAVGTIAGKKVVFISRHGPGHIIPPHKIPCKANIYAFHKLGVKQIISSTAVGSLKVNIKPGDFLVPDQIVNFTHGRDDTFYHGDDGVVHISIADSFCERMRKILIDVLKKEGVHEKGTAVIVNGPRFSTKAESTFFKSQNWDIINMTLYPECALAREMEICYANISLITDYDAGLKDEPTVKHVTVEEVLRLLKENNEKLRTILKEVILSLDDRDCNCMHALDGARIG